MILLKEVGKRLAEPPMAAVRAMESEARQGQLQDGVPPIALSETKAGGVNDENSSGAKVTSINHIIRF